MHPEGHFILTHPGLNLGVLEGLEAILVQRSELIEHPSPPAGGHVGRVLEKEDRLTLTAETGALMHAGEKTIVPKVAACAGRLA